MAGRDPHRVRSYVQIPSARQVSVWFGHVAVEAVETEPADAERHAAALARRWVGLPITIDGRPFRPRVT